MITRRFDLSSHVDHFRARVLQDALTQATADYWLARAQVWESSRPKAGDYHGTATAEQLEEADARCAQIAENCRAHAALYLDALPEEIDPDVAYVIDEVASALTEVAA
jgi:hypothetical protein